MGQWVQLIGSGLLVVSLMFAAGLQLRLADLLALRERPRVLALALLVNVIAIPAVAWLLLTALALPAEIMLGVLLCAAAPGGPSAVLYVNVARLIDELPLTVSLTIALPILGVVTTPLTLSLMPGLPDTLAIPIAPIVGSLIGFQLIPLALGLLIRERRPELAARMAPHAKRTANVTLAALVGAMLILKGYLLAEASLAVWLAMLGAIAISVALGWLAALPGRNTARAGAIVAVSRNISVSIMLASTFFTDPLVEASVLLFGLASFVVPLLLALIWRRAS